MSRRTAFAILTSVSLLGSACSAPIAGRTDRVSPGLALAPGVAQFLAPAPIELSRGSDGTVRVSAAPSPVAGRPGAPGLEVRRVAHEQGGVGVWTQALLDGYCRLPLEDDRMAMPR